MLAMLMVVFVSRINALTIENTNRITLDDLSFDLNLYADTRISEFTFEPLDFTISSSIEDGNPTITYSSEQMDVDIKFAPRTQYMASAWLVSVKATCKQDVYLHDVYLSMDNADNPISASLKGTDAINSRNSEQNKNVIAFTNKVVEYSNARGSYWIIASNYAECEGVEGLVSNRIVLYDYKGHFFRHYVQGGTWEQMRDTMYIPAGGSQEWSFLLFSQKPLLLDINRWPGNNLAALCITNDADSESLVRLQAVYEGSNNPANPKYYTKGFFARNIPVSNSVFGFNQASLGDIWSAIQAHGNTIGYHTYAGTADPPGTNQQALLHDLVPYNIRLWIDHLVPQNPEDVCFNGLNPESANYVGDIINQSGIDYIWAGDTPYSNPFNAFDEAWRLPHLEYEATALSRPIWFFGRTRTEVWDYTNYQEQLSMRYLMNPDNLDNLLENRGLHISYTHLSAGNSSTIKAYFEVAENGDYEVRDEVDDMLQMLDYYRSQRGLWIDTLENIFDRMLAVEQVQVVSCQKVDNGVYQITVQNGSDYDLKDLSFKFLGTSYHIPLFAKGDAQTFYLADNPGLTSAETQNYQMSYRGGNLELKNRYELSMPPMKIEIFNLRGQKVQTFNTTSSQDKWVSPFLHRASGLYFARITSQNAAPSVFKFTVLK